MTGALVIVATPIGNMGDLSIRAAEELAGADLIACEDTRRTGRLLELAGLGKRPLLRLDDHTEVERLDEIASRVESGERVVLVSDAGTPVVSDPGQRLVAHIAGLGLSVTAVPGPSAAIDALVLSGLPAERFCFEGFLPRKGSDRRARLGALVGEPRTTVLYESPHRVAATLTEMAAMMDGDRPVVVARELTKRHESVWRGTIGDAVAWVAEATLKGEFVIVVEGAAPVAATVADADITAALAEQTAKGQSSRDAVDTIARELGVPRNRVYRLAH